jgi:hypothetical protein
MFALQGEYADAAFSEVVSKSLANTVNFGEAIVLGRRCSVSHKPCMESYAVCAVRVYASSRWLIWSSNLPPHRQLPHKWSCLCMVLQGA